MKSREIIHKFVNMARHPEAKDLPEALEMETKFDNCLIEYKNYQYKILDQNNKSKSINGLFIYIQNNEISCQGKTFISKGEYKILGRPITAFDVCWALNKKQPEHYYFATDNGIWASYELKDKCEGIIALTVEFKTKESDGTDIFSTEWSDDTSDTIVKLINL